MLLAAPAVRKGVGSSPTLVTICWLKAEQIAKSCVIRISIVERETKKKYKRERRRREKWLLLCGTIRGKENCVGQSGGKRWLLCGASQISGVARRSDPEMQGQWATCYYTRGIHISDQILELRKSYDEQPKSPIL